MAWLCRGLLFEYLGLAALGAYAKVLRGIGCVLRTDGRAGHFVAPRAGDGADDVSFERFFSRAAAGMWESEIRRMGSLAAQVPDLISFAAGHPDPSTFPWDAIRGIADTLLGGADMNALQYGGTRGYRPLLESLDDVLTPRGIASTLDERIVTTGSQQALDLVGPRAARSRRRDPRGAADLHRRDHRVLPTHRRCSAAVPQDADGVNLEALDDDVPAADVERPPREVPLCGAQLPESDRAS